MTCVRKFLRKLLLLPRLSASLIPHLSPYQYRTALPRNIHEVILLPTLAHHHARLDITTHDSAHGHVTEMWFATVAG